MADRTVFSGVGNIQEKWLDSGDGTFARRMATVQVDPSTGTAATALPARSDVTPNAIPTYASGKAGVDRSITATTTAQQLMAAMTTRGRFYVKNDTAIDVWINIGGTATAAAGTGNIKLAASGGYYELAGCTDAISIIAASGTPAITAREF